jgi:hypothetical protein
MTNGPVAPDPSLFVRSILPHIPLPRAHPLPHTSAATESARILINEKILPCACQSRGATVQCKQANGRHNGQKQDKLIS